MEEKNFKNIVVIKNLPSNIVDEAIVVLKHNKVKLPEYVSSKDNKEKNNNSKDYILKEAQMVILDYLKKIETPNVKNTKNNKTLEKKCKRLQISTFLLAVIAIISAMF